MQTSAFKCGWGSVEFLMVLLLLLECCCLLYFFLSSWVDPLLWFGARNTLQHEDLYAHPPEADSKYLLHKFNKWDYFPVIPVQLVCLFSSVKEWDFAEWLYFMLLLKNF